MAPIKTKLTCLSPQVKSIQSTQTSHESCKKQTHLDGTGLHLGHLGHPLQMLEQRGLGEVTLGQKVLIHVIAQPPPGLLACAHITQWGLCSSAYNQSISISLMAQALSMRRSQSCPQTSAGTIQTIQLWGQSVTVEKVAHSDGLDLTSGSPCLQCDRIVN